MNLKENIQLKRHSLTKNEAKACDMICADLKLVQNCSIQELSEKIGVAKTSIMRFCQKMGYSGYSEFKYEVISYVNSFEKTDKMDEDSVTYAENKYADTIRLIHHTADDQTMTRLAEKIVNAKTVYLAGMVNSSVSAIQMYYSLLMFGIRASVLDSSEAVRSVDLCAGEGDLILVYSVSGKSSIIKRLLELKETNGCELIMITSSTSRSSEYESIILPSLSAARGSLLEDVPVYSVFNAILVEYISQQKKLNKNSNS